MRSLGVGLLGVFLTAGVARAQRATGLRVDSASVVALVLSAIEQLSPRDAGLRPAPWRVEVVDSTSRTLRAAAAGVAAAIPVRPRSERDSVQAILQLEAYAAARRVRRLRFSVATIARCDQAWESVYAYDTSYEVVARSVSGRWVTSPPTELGHGDPTPGCLERPEFGRDRPARPPSNDSLNRTARPASLLPAWESPTACGRAHPGRAVDAAG
jgi:hypothetical protein